MLKLATLALVALVGTVAADQFLKDAATDVMPNDIIPAPVVEAIEFLDGLSKSIINEDIEADLYQCYTDATLIRHDIEHAVRDFEIGGALGYFSGALRTLRLIEEVPQTFTGCEKVSADVEKLVTWAKTQLSDIPALEKRMAYNFLWNESEIMADVSKGVTEFKSNNFFDAGQDIGKAVVLLTQ